MQANSFRFRLTLFIKIHEFYAIIRNIFSNEHHKIYVDNGIIVFNLKIDCTKNQVKLYTHTVVTTYYEKIGHSET